MTLAPPFTFSITANGPRQVGKSLAISMAVAALGEHFHVLETTMSPQEPTDSTLETANVRLRLKHKYQFSGE